MRVWRPTSNPPRSSGSSERLRTSLACTARWPHDCELFRAARSGVAPLPCPSLGARSWRRDRTAYQCLRRGFGPGVPRSGIHEACRLLAEDYEVRVSESRGAPLFRTYSRLWRAQTAEKLGLLDRADEELTAARAESAAISDQASRDRVLAEIELSSVHISTRQDAAEGSRLLVASFRSFRTSDTAEGCPRFC